MVTLCLWPNCGGWIKEALDNNNHIMKICSKCGRSPDLQHEYYVTTESRKKHHNWHTYGGPHKSKKIVLAEILLLGGENEY